MTLDPITRALSKRADDGGFHPCILMYHGTPRGEPSSRYSLNETSFARQLDILSEMGWHTARISELITLETLPPKTVFITFDDGYKDNFEYAFPHLMDRGMTATWYVVTGKVGERADWLDFKNASEAVLMNARDLRSMLDAGMEIGSHTISHPDLKQCEAAHLSAEVIESKRQLEDLLSHDVATFAYPFGRFSEAAVERVREAGYRFACSVRAGFYNPEVHPLLLPRVTVFRGDSIGEFARKLIFASNDTRWRTLIQYGFARLKDRLA